MTAPPADLASAGASASAGVRTQRTITGRIGATATLTDFTPGTLVAGRYRIVALLGKGGMGEVYRADDLKLGQAVALKFLPRALERDTSRLDRFLNEIRTARDISHPNVCRVYDVGEVDGRHFLSMEYIDGEDLASLLRRIGRLPQDKALDISRQLCAGLAAAHDKGVLHRDLKPANVMLDGRGKVRLTDFGLAEIAGSGTGEMAGTPAYMAPEQFGGEPASVRSDVYALGLVLYEVFTGRRVFSADTIAELRRLHEESRPASLTSVVHDIDPLVERVILRCLEKDPRERPASAIAVSAALPGGDPLAAALAAGETPSPDMVAASGEEGGMRLPVAAAWLAVVVGSLIAIIVLSTQVGLFRMVPFDYPPDVLANKAQEMLARLDVTTRVVDTASGFQWEPGCLAYLQGLDRSTGQPKALASGHLLLTFWYRVSPQVLVPRAGTQFQESGRTSLGDPPMTVPGMASVVLDARGRLLRLETVPAQVERPAPATRAEMDWQKVLVETGVDPATVTAIEPAWLPLTWADTRAAWSAKYRDLPGVPVRIEAAAYRGRPVYVRVIRAWTAPDRSESSPGSAGNTLGDLIGVVIVAVMLAGSGLVVRRNLLLGRGDRRGAVRVALAVGGLYLARAILEANHFASGQEWTVLTGAIGSALFVAAWMGLLYLAIEPDVRRLWPHILIGWSRLLIGRFRDPLIGRDVLVGAAAGIALSVVQALAPFVGGSVGTGSAVTVLPRLSPLLGPRFVINSLFAVSFNSLFYALVLAAVLFAARQVLRRDWLVVAAYAGLALLLNVARSAGVVDIAMNMLIVALTAVVLLRLGLLAFVVTEVFRALLAQYPFTMDVSSWHGAPTLMVAFFLIAVAGVAFKIALAGRPLLATARRQ